MDVPSGEGGGSSKGRSGAEQGSVETVLRFPSKLPRFGKASTHRAEDCIPSYKGSCILKTEGWGGMQGRFSVKVHIRTNRTTGEHNQGYDFVIPGHLLHRDERYYWQR